jgi:hypothetical protein
VSSLPSFVPSKAAPTLPHSNQIRVMNTRCSKERSQGSEASSNTLDLKSFGDIAGVHQGYHCAQRVLGVMRGQRQDDTSKEGNGAKWRRRRHASPWPGKAFASAAMEGTWAGSGPGLQRPVILPPLEGAVLAAL